MSGAGGSSGDSLESARAAPGRTPIRGKMSKGKPERVPSEVLEGLEAMRLHAGTDVLDVAFVRYLAIERGQCALAVWLDKHPDEYGRGLLDGFEAVG